MTIFKKRLVVTVLALFTALCLLFGFSGAKEVKADDTDVFAGITFKMIGASVNIDIENEEENNNSGIRFAGKITGDGFETFKTTHAGNITYGIFVMPQFYRDTHGEINEDSAINKGIYVYGAEYTDSTVVENEVTKYRILHAQSNAVYDEKEQGYLVKGTVRKVLAENMAFDYHARAYIAVTVDGQTYYKFAEEMESPRSMLEVAFRAINSGDYDDTEDETIVKQKAVLESYKTKYIEYLGAEPTYTFTMNYVVYGQENPVVSNSYSDKPLNTYIQGTGAIPSGYIADKERETLSRYNAWVYAKDVTVTIYVVEKPTIDLTSQCIDGTIGVLGATCDKETQKLELPVDISGLVSSSESFVVHLNDEGWNYAIWSSYNKETQNLEISTSSAKNMITSCTSGNVIKNATIEGKTAYYKVKVQLLGVKYSLRVIETADDITNNFNTNFFDNRENGGVQYDYHYFVLANDVEGGTINYTADGNNNYASVIDGRGHVLKGVTVGSQGLVNYAVCNTLKNIAIVDAVNNSNEGLIAAWARAGAIIQNVYISGTTPRGAAFTRIAGKVTFTNVVYNVNDGDGKLFNTVYTSFTSWTEATNVSDYVTATNVFAVSDETTDFNFGSFTMTDAGLTFNGKLVYAKA